MMCQTRNVVVHKLIAEDSSKTNDNSVSERKFIVYYRVAIYVTSFESIGAVSGRMCRITCVVRYLSTMFSVVDFSASWYVIYIMILYPTLRLVRIWFHVTSGCFLKLNFRAKGWKFNNNLEVVKTAETRTKKFEKDGLALVSETWQVERWKNVSEPTGE